jgi:hypothetical protein
MSTESKRGRREEKRRIEKKNAIYNLEKLISLLALL